MDEALAYVRSRHLQLRAADGTWTPDPTADFGRIARQQDFLARVLATALDKGLFDPAVAQARIESLQHDIVTEHGVTVQDLIRVAGTLRDIDPASIGHHRIDGKALTVAGNSVLQPVLDTPEMRSVLALFRGEASDSSGATATATAPGLPVIGPQPGVPDPAVGC